MEKKRGRPRRADNKETEGRRICVLLGKDAKDALDSIRNDTGASTTAIVERAILAMSNSES